MLYSGFGKVAYKEGGLLIVQSENLKLTCCANGLGLAGLAIFSKPNTFEIDVGGGIFENWVGENIGTCVVC